MSVAKRVPMQLPPHGKMREEYARVVYAEYERQYGTDQSFDQLHERGGFGAEEAIHLLCQRIKFLEFRFSGMKASEARQAAKRWPE